MLDDGTISTDAPYIRALIAQRLELVWRACLPHIDGSREADGYSVSAPLVDVGLRALKELSKIYRLDNPVAASQEQIAGTNTDFRALVAGNLDQLEQRMEK